MSTHAVPSTCAPSSSMRSMRSANGMKIDAGTSPWSGCCHRASASTPTQCAGREVVLGLVRDVQLAAVDGGRGVGEQLLLEPHRIGRAPVVDDERLPAVLRGCDRALGQVQERVRVLVGGREREPDTRRHRDAAAVDDRGHGQRPLHRVGRLGGRHAGQRDERAGERGRAQPSDYLDRPVDVDRAAPRCRRRAARPRRRRSSRSGARGARPRRRSTQHGRPRRASTRAGRRCDRATPRGSRASIERRSRAQPSPGCADPVPGRASPRSRPPPDRGLPSQSTGRWRPRGSVRPSRARSGADGRAMSCPTRRGA